MHRVALLFALFYCSFFCYSSAAAAAAAPALHTQSLFSSRFPVVQTSYGAVRGFEYKDVNKFLGVPFGAPPVGSLRLRAPQPPQPWTGVRDAFVPGQACPQHLPVGMSIGSEDCLYLNVFVPNKAVKDSNGAGVPVMLWLFGGAFKYGDGYEFDWYDGSNIAREQGVILVAPNSRVGPLGLLALDEFAAEDGSRGNYHMLDQRAAMQWVQHNIAKFGGDPSRVTIYGLSSGGMSVCFHLASEASQGLFSRAIVQSGTCDTNIIYPPVSKFREYSLVYLASLGCARGNMSREEFVSCVQNLPTAAFNVYTLPNVSSVELAQLSALAGLNTEQPYRNPMYPILSFTPVVDGTFTGLRDHPLRVLRARAAAGLPSPLSAVIAGTVKDEGSMFGLEMKNVVPGVHMLIKSMEEVRLVLSHVFGDSAADAVLSMYKPDSFKPGPMQYTNLVDAIVRDSLFVCGTRRLLSQLSSSNVPSFGYHVLYKGDWPEELVLGTYHSMELSLVFGNAFPPLVHAFSDNDKKIGGLMRTYWTNLGRFASPNDGSSPAWPAFNSTEQLLQALDTTPFVLDKASMESSQCDFWDQLTAKLDF